ncbi:hypothetical protein R1sor_018182 [Riccia sorocarpa]|uniref:CCHC-type domain-containing protein n=1 Tax=Riccia sorocarpa TaxID=122646 RepID=A0ABD3ICP5_9MARC
MERNMRSGGGENKCLQKDGDCSMKETENENIALPNTFVSWANVVTGTKGTDGARNDPSGNLPDIDWGTGVEDSQVQEAYTALASRPSFKPGPNATRMTLDLSLARSSYGMYRKLGVIIFTAEDSPSRDRVLQWATTAIENAKGVHIRMLREIARKHFLILLGSEQEKAKLLQNPPTKMEGRAIMLSDWNPSYDYKEASKASKQVWIELPFMDPLLLKQGRIMAETLGPVLFHSSHEANDTKYAHLRACIMRSDTDNLPNAVIVDLPWGGHFVQEVKYTRLPDTCYSCKKRGHRAAQCPDKQQQPTYAQAKGQVVFAVKDTTKGNVPGGFNQGYKTPARQKRTWKPRYATTGDSTPKGGQSTQPTARPGSSSAQGIGLSLNIFAALFTNEDTNSEDVNTGREKLPPLQLDSLTQTSLEKEVTTTQILTATDQETEEDARTQPLQLEMQQTLQTHTTPLGSNHLDTGLSQGQHSLSPLEMTIVAKRRALLDRNASPHGETLGDGERFEQHKRTAGTIPGNSSAEPWDISAIVGEIPHQNSSSSQAAQWALSQETWKDPPTQPLY